MFSLLLGLSIDPGYVEICPASNETDVVVLNCVLQGTHNQQTGKLLNTGSSNSRVCLQQLQGLRGSVASSACVMLLQFEAVGSSLAAGQ